MNIFEQPDMKNYLEKMAKEKDSLIAKFMAETGLKADEIVLVEQKRATDWCFIQTGNPIM